MSRLAVFLLTACLGARAMADWARMHYAASLKA